MNAMEIVILNYLKGFVFISLALILINTLLVKIALKKFPVLCGKKARRIYFLTASAFLFTAGIGRIAWSFKTWAGNSPPEILQRWIFISLLFLGTTLFVFDYLCHGRSKSVTHSPE